MEFNYDSTTMWDWQCPENDLGDDANIDLSISLLDDGRNNDLSNVFDAGTTPVKFCGDMDYYVNDIENNMGLSNCKETSSQVKRRRMLQFESEGSGTNLCTDDYPVSILRSNESQLSFEDGISEMSEWVSGFAGGTSTSDSELLNHSYEGWFADCLKDTEMHLCLEDRNSSDTPDHIDITGLCDTPVPENEKDNVVQAQPIRTRGNVKFKGRKSYMRMPATKEASSVAYPFTFIKPCSVQGEVTLKDINQRIRNPASKSKEKKEEEEEDPFAAYPTSAISGKPVVGKTKIHTVGGQGSITIMRTKG